MPASNISYRRQLQASQQLLGAGQANTNKTDHSATRAAEIEYFNSPRSCAFS
jgi:hypothetical protein